MYRFDSIYSFALELCIEVINLGVKLFTLQIVLLRRSGVGPSGHGGDDWDSSQPSFCFYFKSLYKGMGTLHPQLR